MTTLLRAVRLCAGALAALLVTACGGGSGGDEATVTNMSATGFAFGRNLTVTVQGSSLSTGGLGMTVDRGSCLNVRPGTGGGDAQIQFTCRVDSTGPLTVVVRESESRELARLTVNVATPLVSIAVSDGVLTGTFTVELEPDRAPITTRNFIAYVAANFYNDTIIHRVLPGRIIQGGGYNDDFELKPTLFAPIVLEDDKGLKNLKGTIAMARTSARDSATAQFYVNAIDNPDFDRAEGRDGYAVFGRVVSGLEVVEQVSRVELIGIGQFVSTPARTMRITAVTQIQ